MMARSPESVLICGFGAFGALHAAAWRQLAYAPHLMVSDPDAEAQARAKAQGIERVADRPDRFLEDADIVDIVAPPRHHLPLALEALTAGKPVLLEKPAVRSSAEAGRLVDASDASGTAVQVGLVLRCHPITLRAQKMLRAGAIGRLLACEGDFSGWKRMRADSSLVENDGVHFLDLMRHLADAPVTAVDARAHRLLGGPDADDIGIDLTFENGIVGRLRLGVLTAGAAEDSFVPGAVTTKSLRLIGERGNLVLDFNRNRLFHGEVRYEAVTGGWNVTPGTLHEEQVVGTTPAWLLARSFEIFMRAVRGQGDVMCNAREGALEVARVTDAIARAVSRPALEALEVEV